MKRTTKQILGLIGFFLVVAITIFAATLPNPEASAYTKTEHIILRVAGTTPRVAIVNPRPDAILVSPEQNIELEYENVGPTTITVEYTDEDGIAQSHLLESTDFSYSPGTKTYSLNLSGPNFGYGEYIITVVGTSIDGVEDNDSIAFSYYPVTAEPAEDEETGKIYLDLNYYTGDAISVPENEINYLDVNVYDEQGNLVSGMSPIRINAPDMRAELPFAELGLESGKYRVEVTAYNAGGETLYLPFVTYVDYEVIPVPNTGALWQSLNISKTDYLITGLIVFFILGIGGIVFIRKRERYDKSQRR